MKISTDLSDPTAREWREGWRLLLAAAFANSYAMLPFYVIGALVKPIGHAFGWSRTTVTASAFIFAIGVAVLTPLVGILIDRVGPRRVGIVGVPACAFALTLVGFTGPSPASWYAAWILFALVSPTAGPLVWATGVTRQFDRRRAFALSLMLVGATIAMSAGPIGTSWLTLHFGWRSVFRLLGFIGLVTSVLVFLFFRTAGPAAPGVTRVSAAGLSFAEALKVRSFWLLLSATILGAASSSIVIIQLQPVLSDAGMTAERAAVIAALMGPAALIARLLSGWLADRFHAATIVAVVLVCPALGFLLILLGQPSALVGAAVAILGGVALGAEVDLFAVLSSRCFGQRNFATIHGTMISANGIGFAAAAIVSARIYDRTGSYHAILIPMAIGSVLAALCMTAIRPEQMLFRRGGPR